MKRILIGVLIICLFLSSCAINGGLSSDAAKSENLSSETDKQEARQQRAEEAASNEETGLVAGFVYPGADTLSENLIARELGFDGGLYFCEPSGEKIRFDGEDVYTFVKDNIGKAATDTPDMKYMRIMAYSMGGASGYDVNDLTSGLNGYTSTVNQYASNGTVVFYTIRRMMSIEEFNGDVASDIKCLLNSENVYCVVLSLYETPYDRQAVEH
ncbi:MAG: hypothetical protein J6330_07375 [Clostridia bacterium]|nr:hypothetical protein [Clostridia bacterium]